MRACNVYMGVHGAVHVHVLMCDASSSWFLCTCARAALHDDVVGATVCTLSTAGKTKRHLAHTANPSDPIPHTLHSGPTIHPTTATWWVSNLKTELRASSGCRLGTSSYPFLSFLFFFTLFCWLHSACTHPLHN